MDHGPGDYYDPSSMVMSDLETTATTTRTTGVSSHGEDRIPAGDYFTTDGALMDAMAGPNKDGVGSESTNNLSYYKTSTGGPEDGLGMDPQQSINPANESSMGNELAPPSLSDVVQNGSNDDNRKMSRPSKEATAAAAAAANPGNPVSNSTKNDQGPSSRMESEYDAIARETALLLDKRLDNIRGWTKKLLRELTVFVKTLEEVGTEYNRIQSLEQTESDRLDQVEPDVEGATSHLLQHSHLAGSDGTGPTTGMMSSYGTGNRERNIVPGTKRKLHQN